MKIKRAILLLIILFAEPVYAYYGTTVENNPVTVSAYIMSETSIYFYILLGIIGLIILIYFFKKRKGNKK